MFKSVGINYFISLPYFFLCLKIEITTLMAFTRKYNLLWNYNVDGLFLNSYSKIEFIIIIVVVVPSFVSRKCMHLYLYFLISVQVRAFWIRRFICGCQFWSSFFYWVPLLLFHSAFSVTINIPFLRILWYLYIIFLFSWSFDNVLLSSLIFATASLCSINNIFRNFLLDHISKAVVCFPNTPLWSNFHKRISLLASLSYSRVLNSILVFLVLCWNY